MIFIIQYRFFKSLFFHIFLLVIFFLPSSGICLDNVKTILVIHSYNSDFEWTKDVTAGISSILKDDACVIQNEYLEGKRHSDEKSINLSYEIMRLRMAERFFDVVIVSDNIAFDFIIKNRRVLPPDTPIVFCGVNNFVREQIDGVSGITGVGESISVRETLDSALRLQPGARKVFVLGSDEISERKNLEAIREVAPDYSNRIEFVYFTDMRMNPLKEALGRLASDDIVLLTGILRDPSGNPLDFSLRTQFVHKHSPAPIYSFWRHNLGHGIVGGKLLSAEGQGRMAATMARRILSGESPGNIPVASSEANSFAFDFAVLKEHGLDPGLLPEGAEVINREPSFFQRYASEILFLVLALLEAFIIMLLVFNILRRRKIARMLQASESRYRRLVADIREGLSVVTADGRFLFANERAALNFSGRADPDAIIGRNVRDFLEPDQAEILVREYGRVLAEGIPIVRDMNLTTASGEMWFQHSLSPVEFGEKREQGVLSLSLDITEQMKLIGHLRQYETALESIQDMIARIDREHVYVMANQAYLEWVGRSRGDVVGRSLGDVLGASYEQVAPLLDRALAGERVHFCLVMDRSDRGRCFVEALYLPVTDEREETTVVAVLRDLTAEKLAGEAYRESEERFRLTFEQTAMGMCLCRVDGSFMRVNEALCGMTGYAEHELLGMTFGDITHPEDLASEVEQVRAILAGELDTYVREKRYIRKTGEVIFVSIIVSAMRDGQGRLQYFIGAVQDVTIQKHVREERERHTKHLQDVLNATTSGIWEWNLSSGALSFSPRYYTMLGYDPGEFDASYEQWLDLVHPEDRESARAVAAAWLESMQGMYRNTFRMRTRQGTYRWIEAQGRVVEHDEHGRPLRMIGNHEDVTERVRAEQDLQEAHWRLSFHIENSPLGVVEWENGTHIKMWSRQAEKIFGWKADEVMGKNWADFDFIHPGDQEIAGRQIARLFDGSDAFNTVSNRNFRKDGTVVHCQWFNSPLRDSLGNIVSILSQVADVSALKEYERNLLKAKEQAEAANKAKSDFLANMSHEIRTPLNGVLGMLQLMRITPLDGEQQEYVDTAIQSSQRLTGLLSDILDISRIEANRLSLRLEPFDLFKTVRDTTVLFEAVSRQAGVAFVCSVSPETPQWVVGDSLRLTQVLNNLLGNAFKFTSEGEVRLEVYPLPVSREGSTNVHFVVSDTGIGIPDDKIGDLFKPFSQGVEGFKREFQGAGLGLSICKQLLELMGGNMAFWSESGAGSAFHFTVALETVDRPEAVPLPVSGRSALPGRPLRILVAEDDAVSGMAISGLLESRGHTVTIAPDGMQAVQRLSEDHFDIVFMDIQLPVMDGVETVAAIRSGAAGGDRADIPIVALTAYAMHGDRERFLHAGMDGYLGKPVAMNELEEILGRLAQGD